MTLGSLFAGIGGFELAATWAGITPVWSNEIDPWCCKVLIKNFNHEIKEGDIAKQTFGYVDIITGGFPCQPFSHAGKRKGTDDDRYIWPEMLRVIEDIGPSWVIIENVAGLKSMEDGNTLEGILNDMENIGYQTETFLVPACSVGAWHRRDRIWIVCHATHPLSCGRNNRSKQSDLDRKQACSEKENRTSVRSKITRHGEDVANPEGQHERVTWLCQEQQEGKIGRSDNGNREHSGWQTEPDVGRVANEISRRVDRLKGLGNAIVPQVAYEIFKAITKHN